ncbi:DNA alkylation repair protein [Actinomadura sp. KC345]|uniref:DNA alkylation repair protein n=1 Tax=Actinomadura sp. KC345 TaxID=2530371 RepID=UPI001046B0EF|nr:DNA alkylation repair protein [Actinomadura sp. KC345]TDC44854.1 DNA alkylation repair protein [Actinomadura sp. KC345]
MRAQGDSVRAANEKRYLKSDFVHIGVPVPALRKVAVSAVKTTPTRDELLALAEKVVGRLVVRHPDLGSVLDAWVADPYMWVRRAAVLALLAGIRNGSPDLVRIDKFGDALIGEREFFIRKALGWVLRELSKKDPGWVARWVEPRVEVISGVTLREAVRWLPEEDAGRLRATQRR